MAVVAVQTGNDEIDHCANDKTCADQRKNAMRQHPHAVSAIPSTFLLPHSCARLMRPTGASWQKYLGQDANDYYYYCYNPLW